MKPKLPSLLRIRSERLRSASFVAGVAGSLLLGGCSITGFGSSSLTCKLPDGARCDSVSSTYSESQRGTLPGQLKRKAAEGPADSVSPSGTSRDGGATMYVDPRMTQVGMPLRSQARVARVWIKPWEDSDGDLHDQTFIYLPVDEGRWLVEHKQREVRQAYSSTSARPSPARSGMSMPAADMKTSLPPSPGAQTGASVNKQEKVAEAVKRMQPKPTNASTKTLGDGSGS